MQSKCGNTTNNVHGNTYITNHHYSALLTSYFPTLYFSYVCQVLAVLLCSFYSKFLIFSINSLLSTWEIKSYNLKNCLTQVFWMQQANCSLESSEQNSKFGWKICGRKISPVINDVIAYRSGCYLPLCGDAEDRRVLHSVRHYTVDTVNPHPQKD